MTELTKQLYHVSKVKMDARKRERAGELSEAVHQLRDMKQLGQGSDGDCR